MTTAKFRKLSKIPTRMQHKFVYFQTPINFGISILIFKFENVSYIQYEGEFVREVLADALAKQIHLKGE